MGYYEEYGLQMIFVNTAVIAIGWIVRHSLSSNTARQFTGSVLTLVIAFVVDTQTAFFFLISTVVTAVWLKLPAQKKTVHAMYLTCALLFTIRILCNYYDLNMSVLRSMHMYCTLRCCSVVYETFLLHSKNKHHNNHASAPRGLEEEPNLIDVLCYVNFSPGLSLGPFYTFQTYEDFIDSSPKTLQEIPYKKQAGRKILHCFILALIFWMTDAYFLDIIGVNFTNFANKSFLRRLIRVFLSGTQMSCFLYIWWRAGECACIVWGIGAYKVDAKPGQGPIKQTEKYSECNWNYNTISNGDGDLWFLKKSMPDAINSWNVTVQWWLVRHCYTQPIIQTKSKFYRIAFTQFVNVLWHGGATRYWVTLMSVILMVYFDRFAEQSISVYFYTKIGKRTAVTCKYLSFQLILLPFLVFSCSQQFDLIRDFLIFTMPEVIFYVCVINVMPIFVEIYGRIKFKP